MGKQWIGQQKSCDLSHRTDVNVKSTDVKVHVKKHKVIKTWNAERSDVKMVILSSNPGQIICAI